MIDRLSGRSHGQCFVTAIPDISGDSALSLRYRGICIGFGSCLNHQNSVDFRSVQGMGEMNRMKNMLCFHK